MYFLGKPALYCFDFASVNVLLLNLATINTRGLELGNYRTFKTHSERPVSVPTTATFEVHTTCGN